MSRQAPPIYRQARRAPLGLALRRLREERSLPGWKAAAAASMDSAVLSKIENGVRLPTDDQFAALLKFYGVPRAQLEGQLVAERMLKSFGKSPAFTDAVAIVREMGCEYGVKKVGAAGSKSEKSVNNRKKMK
jgi:hypothetical protein